MDSSSGGKLEDRNWDAQRPLYEVKANLFKGLSHPVRVRVLELLCAQPETSVSELLEDTGLEASHLSQHLSVLRRHHLVVAERRGSLVFYRIAFPQVADFLLVARHLLTEVLQQNQQQLMSTIELPDVPLAHTQ
ncbi:helix-turn-helix transcriptional regulator [Paramicrobacterium chengjingii]|uniref:Helix-turn-helix transcriptional regulator n=2 Tax=Paramicrobacterium chengjingii TaxID=2769067 RepID=A0ABX6YN93_9MICO|nr:helix-turn-helix transcriptional regulator [Microbacterium chengjingii]